MTDLSPKGIAEHYRGSDATFGEPMPFGQIAETTHFHLFTMPVVFIIMAHVLYLTMASPMIKVVSTWVAFIGVTLDLISPWLIAYISPIFVLTMLTGDIFMVISFLVMFVIPMYEMWFLKLPFMMSGDNE